MKGGGRKAKFTPHPFSVLHLLGCLFTIASSVALPPAPEPELIYHFAEAPVRVWALPGEAGAPADIAVGLDPTRLLVIAGDSQRVIWEHCCSSPVADVRVLAEPGEDGLLIVAAGRTVTAFDRAYRERWRATLPPDQEGAIRFLRTGDVNGDRRTELIVVADRSIQIYSPDGRNLGSIPRDQISLGDSLESPRDIAVTGLDGDSVAELIVLDGRDLRVFAGVGETVPSATGTGSARPPRRFEVGDVNGDGHTEIVALSPADRGRLPHRTRTARGRADRPLLLRGIAPGVLVIALLVLVWFLRRRLRLALRTRPRSLSRTAPELMALGNEIISLDHVFVVKGNLTGAVNRLKEARQRLGLMHDPDLAAVSDRLEPSYSRFIYRLINSPKTVNLVDFFEAAARVLAPRNAALNVATMTKQQFEQQLQGADLPGHWLVKIQNWDRPDIFRDFRIYHDPRAERYFEHWLADNLRYARSRSIVAFEYSINTVWNRKMTVRFYNDGESVIDRHRPKSNLAAQLQEISHDYGSFLEILTGPAELEPEEKLRLRIWDFISILEDIYRRQTEERRAGPSPDAQTKE